MAQQVAVMGLAMGLGIAGIVLLQRRLFKGGRRKKAPAIPPDHGAFLLRFQILPPPNPPPPAAPLPLRGKTFAVKDIFDVEGYVTGFGNPTWANTHEAATRTAPCVQDVIRDGATLEGKLHMDDMAYSVLGRSTLLGQPVNPLAPEHFPGGSSSGCGVAVAADLVDFSLGTDTAGSIRIPAANCGVLGYRPTHGAVSAVGVLPMAPSLDTVGLIAKDPAVLHHVGHTLLHLPFMDRRAPQRVILADDLFDLSSCPRAPVTESLIAVTEKFLGMGVKYLKVGELLARKVPSLEAFLPPKKTAGATANGVQEGPGAGSEWLVALAEAQRTLQRLEFRDSHGEWVVSNSPVLHDHVAPRVGAATEGVVLSEAPPEERGDSASGQGDSALGADSAPAASTASSCSASASEQGDHAPAPRHRKPNVVESEEEKSLRRRALKAKDELRQALNAALENDALLALPVIPQLPLAVDSPEKVLDEYRAKAMQLVSLSSMSGLPQVVIPVGRHVDRPEGGRKGSPGGEPVGLPLSVGFMARSGADRFLLDASCLWAPVLPEAYAEYMATRQTRAASDKGAEEGTTSGRVDSSGARSQNGIPQKSPAEIAKDNGNAAYKDKQYEKAVDYYSEAIRLDPMNATYYSNRAMAYLNLKNMEQVEADCSAALELDKKNVKALLRRGTAREFMGMYLEAYQDFSDALVLEPTNKTAIEGRSRIEQGGVV